ncbi:MAG: NifB/NifX family molybdenum-iron cluster-binding protein [Desulfobacter sp.]|nr:MAG: NifB/NifX family molybdenum-iron cluster-binding protein [Desulfobacter sp.]
MKIAFPVEEDKGIQSRVNEHFGVAKAFMIVDMDTRDIQVIANKKAAGATSCKTKFIDKDSGVTAVVTKCIGDGSQRGLHGEGIKIYAAQAETVAQNLDLYEKGELKLFHMFDLCQEKKNKKEGGCGHHH